MADAAPRVAVLDVDELPDGVLAVAGHAGRHALGDGRDLAADDQAAVVVAGDVASRRRRRRERLWASAPANAAAHRLVAAQVEMDASAVVAVERLDHAREADPLGRGDWRRPRSRPAPTRGPAGRRCRAARWSGSCPTRCRRRWRSSCEVIVARMRCWWTPWPNWTSEWRSRRMNGMSRQTASSMRAWVDGPEGLPLGEPDEPFQQRREVEEDLGIVGRDEVVDEARPRCARPRCRPPPRGTRRCSCTGRTARPNGSCRGGRRCRQGSGTRARCARRRGPPRCPP